MGSPALLRGRGEDDLIPSSPRQRPSRPFLVCLTAEYRAACSFVTPSCLGAQAQLPSDTLLTQLQNSTAPITNE